MGAAGNAAEAVTKRQRRLTKHLVLCIHGKEDSTGHLRSSSLRRRRLADAETSGIRIRWTLSASLLPFLPRRPEIEPSAG